MQSLGILLCNQPAIRVLPWDHTCLECAVDNMLLLEKRRCSHFTGSRPRQYYTIQQRGGCRYYVAHLCVESNPESADKCVFVVEGVLEAIQHGRDDYVHVFKWRPELPELSDSPIAVRFLPDTRGDNVLCVARSLDDSADAWPCRFSPVSNGDPTYRILREYAVEANASQTLPRSWNELPRSP